MSPRADWYSIVELQEECRVKADPCIVESQIPLLEGSTYQALCGREIERAKFVAGWDVLEFGVRLKDLPKGICRKCRQQWENMSFEHVEQLAERHYVYAIRAAKMENEIEAA